MSVPSSRLYQESPLSYPHINSHEKRTRDTGHGSTIDIMGHCMSIFNIHDRFEILGIGSIDVHVASICEHHGYISPPFQNCHGDTEEEEINSRIGEF